MMEMRSDNNMSLVYLQSCAAIRIGTEEDGSISGKALGFSAIPTLHMAGACFYTAAIDAPGWNHIQGARSI